MNFLISLLLTLIILVTTSYQLNAATSEEKKGISGSYEFIFEISVDNSTQFLKEKTNEVAILKGAKIIVLSTNETHVFYQYWNYKVKDKDSTKYKKYNKGKVFQMKIDEFIQNTRPIYNCYKGASVGAYTIPFRLRSLGGSDFDFESSLSLQANLVFGFGSIYSEVSFIDVSIGIGITSINLTSKNSVVTEERTATAYTISGGMLFKFTPSANIGIYYGVDLLGKTDSEVKWKHDGKGWLGIGINVSFDVISTDNDSEFKND